MYPRAQVGVRFDTQDVGAPWIDGINGSPKGMADQVPEERTSDTSRFFRGPNDGNAPGREDGSEGMAQPVAKKGGRDSSIGERTSGWSPRSPCLHMSPGPFIDNNKSRCRTWVVRSLLQFALRRVAPGSMLFFIGLFTCTQLQHLPGKAAVTIDGNALEYQVVGFAVDRSHQLG